MPLTLASLLPASRALVRDIGPFRLRRIRPGLGLDPDGGDVGFGPLGLVDHARLSPGLRVAMHEHRNDEIISYLRSGRLWHRDTTGQSLALDPTHLAVMNSGAGLWHEESIPSDGQSVEMLQIFVRPTTEDLPPRFQHVELPAAHSTNAWRLLVAPEGENAPATVRSRVWMYDARLEAGGSVLATPVDATASGWLYAFSGAAEVVGHGRLATGDSLRFAAGATQTIVARENVELVLILVENDARFSRAGSLSG